LVIAHVDLDAAEGGTRPANSRAGAAGKRRSRRHKGKGGWPTSKSLKWSDVRDISALAHCASYNVLLHIMPMTGTDAERKRHIARIVAHLGQALQRRGQEHLGTTVYEKKDDADLHGHHLCRIEKGNECVLAKYDGYIVRVEIILKLYERVAYVTKQRRSLPPEFEKVVAHWRQGGMPIKGPRFSHTRAAKQVLLDLDHERVVHAERRTSSYFQSPTTTAPIADVGAINLTGQLELLPRVSPARLRVFQGGLMPAAVALETRHLQRRRGLSQQQLANRIGISRPQLANGLQGRFPLSDWASARLREALLTDHQIIEAA
jgi:hypothetical protein